MSTQMDYQDFVRRGLAAQKAVDQAADTKRLRVWTYDVPREFNAFTLRMPKDAEIFWVGRQHQTARALALVNPELAQEERYFHVVETGQAIATPAEMEAEFAKQGKAVKVTGLRPLGVWLEFGERVKSLLEIEVERHAREIEEQSDGAAISGDTAGK